MCIAIGLFCCTALAPQQAQAAELKNLATDSTALSVNTKAVAGSVVIGENGVSITNWNNTTEANPTAAIFVNNKVNSGDTVTATVNAYTAGAASGRLLLQMRFTQACADENIWHFTGKNAGKFINMDFQHGWLELSTRQNASYTVISTPASGNGGKNGELSGGYNIFDNTDHVITMSKVDTATGIAITVAVDGVAYVKDFAIDDLDLQGSYYFAMGMATWDVVTPTAGEHLDISSLTVSGVYEAEPVRPLANLAKDESKLSVNTKAVAGSVVIGENGVSITNWNNTTEGNPTAAIFVNDKVNSGDTVTATVNAYSAGTASGRLLLQMRFTEACADENIWHFTGKNAGKFINMDFQHGWLELSTRQNASYTVISTPASGNGGKNGELSGGYNIFDNTDHVITMTKVDTATGIAITVAVDGVAYVKDFAIDDPDLQGSYYFAMGMATWDVVTPTAGEHLDISSLTVSGVYEAEPVRPLANLAKDATAFSVNTNVVDGAVEFDSDGISITNWNNSTENYATAGVFLNNKVNSGDTVTATVNAYSASTASGRLLFQMRFTPNAQDASLWTFGCGAANAGKVLMMDFRPGWLQLETRDNGTWNAETQYASGNANKNGELSGGYNIFDNTDHVVTLSKVDTATGILITVAVDGVAYVKDFAIDDLDLQGSYYFAMGMATWTATTPTAGEHLDVSSLTVSGVYEAEPVRPLANLAKDESKLSVNTKAVAGSVVIGENGVSITNWNNTTEANPTAAIFVNDKVNSGDTVTATVNAYSAGTASGRLLLQMRFTQACADENIWHFTGKNAGKFINMDFQHGWLELSTRQNASYTVISTPASGNGGKNGELSGGYNIFDNTDHVITMTKVDTATGIAITVAVDGVAYVKDFAIDDLDLQGSYYFAMGMATWDVVTPTAGEHLDISSLTVSGVYAEEEEEPVIRDFENLVFADASVEYDGQAHNLAVTGVPEGATVTYDKADLVEVGTYVITATVAMEGYNTATLTATLTITAKQL